MPEIKHNFTGGKMNKDVDQRLVPKGEYRDAMNIQVSTSEGSDVGTVQNILGNSLVQTQALLDYNDHECIGSVSDEKNDAFYWLVAEKTWKDQMQAYSTISLNQSVHTNSSPLLDIMITNFAAFTSNPLWIKESKSIILQHKDDNINVVFVDKASVTVTAWQGAGTGSGGQSQFDMASNDYVSGDTLVVSSGFSSWGTGGSGYTNTTSYQLEVYDVSNIHPGMTVKGLGLDPYYHKLINYWENAVVVSIEEVGTWVDSFGKTRIQGIVQLNVNTGGFACMEPPVSFQEFGSVQPSAWQQTYISGGCGYKNLGQWMPLSMVVTHWVFETQTLDLDIKYPVTGINIVDDLLFWTDNNSEPKCININDSINGTDQSGLVHTNILVEDRNISADLGTEVAARQKHVTTIKSPPKNAPMLRVGVARDGNSNGLIYGLDLQGVGVGQSITGVDIISPFGDGLNYQEGDSLALKNIDSYSGVASPSEYYPINAVDSELVLVITSIGSQSLSGMFNVTLEVVNFALIGAQLGTLDYACDWLEDTKPLYRLKFPRFATRYKYKDNQYSPFSPFSEIAFQPGNYSFNARVGHNSGMENIISRLTLLDIITPDMPEDVVAIDILYKESNSPNIYVVDTIVNIPPTLPADPTSQLFNQLTDDYGYLITAESISHTLPSNQLLRPYDNVPRKALAQDVTGNRIVYANYLQNYSIDKNKINLRSWVTPYSSTGVSKSLKSLRDYDIGIMFADKYGRETPIITSANSKITIDKDKADGNNRFNIKWYPIDGYQLPSWVDSYKFYIKETSSDYYNLAMDRFYDAEDGNVWLSFPSSDRNKVDDETYLILKKEQGSDQLAKNDYRYKILDISNEVPDYVKVDKQNVGKFVQGTDSFNATNYGRGSLDIIDVDANDDGGLFMDPDNYNNKVYESDVLINGLPGHYKLHLIGRTHFDNTPAIGRLKLRSLISKDHEVEIRLSTIKPVGSSETEQGKYTTKWYKLQDITYYRQAGLFEDDGGSGQSRVSEFTFHLAEPFNNDAEFFFTDQSGTVTVPTTNGAPVLEIRKLIPRENKAEFNGRFFVKILKDISFYEQVLSNTGTEQLVSSLNHDFGYVKDYSQEDIGGLTATETQANFYDAMSGSTPTMGGIMAQISALPHSWAAARYTGGGTMDGVPIPTKSYYHPKTWGYILRKTHGSNANGWFIDEAFATAVDGIDSLGISAEWGEDGKQSRTDILERNQQSLFGGWNSASAPQITLDYNAGVDTDMETLYNFPYYENILTELTGCVPQDDNTSYSTPGVCGDNRYPTIDIPLLNHGSNLSAYQYFHLGNGAGANTGRSNRLDLSFIGGIHDEWKTKGKLQPATWINFFDQLHMRYNLPDDYWDVWEQLVVGNKFKFADDPTDEVFTIVSVSVSLKNNYSEGYYDDTYPGASDLSGYQSNYPHSASTNINHSSAYTNNANHRITWSLELDKNIGDSGFTPTIGNAVGIPGYAGVWDTPGINTNLSRIIFLEAKMVFDGFGVDSSIDPSIWETEPKESTDLDVYYEASRTYQLSISKENALTTIPVGSIVSSTTSTGTVDPGTIVVDWQSRQIGPNIVIVTNKPLTYNNGYNLMFTLQDGSEVQVEYWTSASTATYPDADASNPLNTSGSLDYYQYYVKPFLLGLPKGLSWSNCYSFNNGVESNRIRDDFNAVKIDNGATVSTILDEPYEEERRKYGLIYSGIYNSTSGVNNFNQFIAAEKITKDINPIYGSIQKLHSGWGQGGDLVALCEDRVLKILANKDALFNADGNTNVTSTNNVLGQAIPYSGEYGISKNPESFASEAYRIYFTDKVRGTVMRLSMDGLTPISNHGMKDWFRDHLKLGDKLIGSYDDKKDEYNVTIKGDTIAKTVTFKEDVKGWVSFKSFTPENAISCANEYYTFKDGNIWKHHDEFVNRNTFYDQDLVPSTLEVVFNEVPGSVKSFKTVNYEGSQAKVTKETGDNEYFNLADVEGWHVTNVITNLEQGGITEFINKEGKWFGYVTGNDVTINPTGNVSGNYDTEDSSIQGIGRTAGTTTSVVFGCMDNTMFNYNDAATNDDGSCIDFNHGCTDASADNYLPSANTDDGTCYWLGCTTGPLAVWSQEAAGGSMNFDSNATVDDGSCIPAVWGCTISGNWNYNPSANFGSGILSDGTSCGYADCMCIPIIPGCTDTTADNYITPVDEMTDVNYDDGSCEYLGCTDPIATNYSFTGSSPVVDGPNGNLTYLNGTAVDDGLCTYIGGCMDATACNYDASATVDNGLCNYCGDTDVSTINNDGADPSCTTGCEYCYGPTNLQIISQTTADAGMSNGEVVIEWTESTSPTINYYQLGYLGNIVDIFDSGTGTETYTITGLPAGTLTITLSGLCDMTGLYAGNLALGSTVSTSVTITSTPIPGCTDGTGANNNVGGTWGACNYDPIATVDDGTCEYATCTGCNDNTFLEFCGDCWDAVNQVVVVGGGSTWVADTIPTSCLTLIVPGCMDVTAINFDPAATVDDGSCITAIPGCMDDTLNNDGTYAASNYNALANVDDGSCNPYNCPTIEITQSSTNTTFKINTYNTPYPNTSAYWNGSGTNATIDGNNVTLNPWSSGMSGNTVIGVKTSEPTMNYVAVVSPPSTTVDIVFNVITVDGNCSITETQTFTIGCADSAATNATGFDISDNTQCTYSGCIDATACNFNAGATIDDGSCTYGGCTDPTASNYDAAAGCDDGSCVIAGCMDATLNADGFGLYAADNYDPDATTPCNDGTNDNSCCTYTGTPLVSELQGFGFGGSTAYQRIRATGDNYGTAYNSALVTSIDLGVGTNTATITNPGIEIDPSQSGVTWSGGTQAFSGLVQQNEWAPHVDINGAYGVASGDLTITYHADWSGPIINPSMNDVITTSTSNTFVLSAGCKTDASAMNYNPNLDLQIDGSCIAPNPGCMDATATNYDAAFNQDCTFDGSTNPNDCCCYTCDEPTFDATNPVVVNTWNDPITPTYATQITFNFASVDTATSYAILIDNGASPPGFISIVSPTINSGLASYTYNTNFNYFLNESTYDFQVIAVCENNDGDSCGNSESATITITLND